jgi:hypothetical protein
MASLHSEWSACLLGEIANRHFKEDYPKTARKGGFCVSGDADRICGVMSEQDIHQLAEKGAITPDSLIWGEKLPENGIPYSDLHLDYGSLAAHK